MDFDAIVQAFAQFLRQQQGMAQPFQGLEAQPQQEAPEATMAETAATPSMLAQTFGMQAPRGGLFGNIGEMIAPLARPGIDSIRSQPPQKQPMPQQSGPVFQSIRSQPPVKQLQQGLSRPMGSLGGAISGALGGGSAVSVARRDPNQPVTNIRRPPGRGTFAGAVRGIAALGNRQQVESMFPQGQGPTDEQLRGVASRLTRIF
jgi:hypothetical protein